MNRFESMRVFARVVEAGGFAAAARQLGLSRSVVNRHVIKLENELGVALFVRSTRRVAPTETGRAFYQRCLAILGDVEEAFISAAEAHDAPRGQLRVNAPMSFGTLHLSGAVSDFMALHPGLHVRLNLNDRFVDPLEEGYDVTLRIAEPVESMTLAVERVAEARRVLCASPGYLARHGAPRQPADLKDHACLHYGHLASGNVWTLSGPDGARTVHVNGALCSNNAEVLRDGAVSGHGIALLPTFIAGGELQTGRLGSVLAEYTPPSLEIQLLYPLHRHLSAKVRVFSQFIRERFGDRPYWDLVT